MRGKILIVLMLLVAASSSAAQPARRRVVGRGQPTQIVIKDDFLGGWFAGFAEYSPLNREMDLQAVIRALPPEIGPGSGFFISGQNRSDDLFMFLTRPVTARDGIKPNQRYEVTFRIVFASNAGGVGCSGIGGAPGLSVFLKAGASGEQPRVEIAADGSYRLNVDKGNQASGGPAATVAGTISTGSSNCSADAPFQIIDRVHRHTFVVTSSSDGLLWLLVGTDSGFEGKTSLYYISITASLTAL